MDQEQDQQPKQTPSEPAQQPPAPQPAQVEPLSAADFREIKKTWATNRDVFTPSQLDPDFRELIDRLFATVQAVCEHGVKQQEAMDGHLARIAQLFSATVAVCGRSGRVLLRRQVLESWPDGANVEIKKMPDGDVALAAIAPRNAVKARRNGKQRDIPPAPPILGPDGMPFPR